MKISIEISDYEVESKVEAILKHKIEMMVNQKIEDVLRNTKIDESLILKRVDYLIDKSKYVSDSIIRNFVQQRVAKEITSEILKDKL